MTIRRSPNRLPHGISVPQNGHLCENILNVVGRVVTRRSWRLVGTKRSKHSNSLTVGIKVRATHVSPNKQAYCGIDRTETLSTTKFILQRLFSQLSFAPSANELYSTDVNCH